MKKLICLVLAVLSLAALCACGQQGDTSLSDVQKAGKLVGASNPEYPPFEMMDDNNEATGIEVDILNAICEEMGVEFVLESMEFDAVLPGVQAGKYDVGVSGITMTEERLKNMDFSHVYFMASQAILIPAGSTEIQGKEDLEGKQIAVQTGTTAESFCMGEGYDVQAYASNNDAASALEAGKVDAWVVDNEVAVAFAADRGFDMLDEKMTSEPYAFAFKKGSTALEDEFNRILDELMEDGTIEAIFDSYGVPYVGPEE